MHADESGRRCGQCGCRLSRYNPQPVCGPCERAAHQGEAVPYPRISSDVWDRPDVRDAAERWDLGAVCARVRVHAGLNQTDLAELTGRSQGYISMLESGQRHPPGIDLLRDIVEGLGMPTGLLGSGAVSPRPDQPTADGFSALHPVPAQAPWTPAATVDALEEALRSGQVDRRTFVLMSGTSLTTYAHQWATEHTPALANALDGGRLDSELVTRIEAAVDNLRYMDAELGGGTLRDLGDAQLKLIIRLLKQGRYSERLGRRLHAAACDVAGLIGWFLVDAGQHAQAQRYFTAALQAAHTAAAPLFGAEVISYMTVQSYSAGDPRDAVAMAQAAQQKLRRQSTPYVDAVLAIRQARAHAKTRDAARCHRALNTAFTRFADGTRDDDPVWLYWMSDGELYGQAASCFLDLGDYPRALRYFRRAYHAYEEFCLRDRAMCLARTATALAKHRDGEQAVTVALDALDLVEQIDSDRLTDQLRTLDDELQPYRHLSGAEEFTDRATALLQPTANG